MRIAIDAMGGDFAPKEIVRGAIDAAKKYDCEIVLVGDESKIRAELGGADMDTLHISIVHAADVIGMNEAPAEAVRSKKEASIVVATRMVKEGTCDAVFSAGSTGAAVAAAQLILHRIRGVSRPTIATPMPTPDGVTLMLDSGANVDSKPEHLVQSAVMGSLYAQYVFGIERPRVGLLNIGEEETKGNEQAKETYPLLKTDPNIYFCGNAEGRDVPKGNFDVVVCDGFVGNVILKLTEGLGWTILKLLKNLFYSGVKNKFAGLMLKGDLKNMKDEFDYSEYGGAPIIGVRGAVLKIHGSSGSRAVMNTIIKGIPFGEKRVVEKIEKDILKLDEGTL